MVSASRELVGGDEPRGEGLAGELPFRGLEVLCGLEVSAPERVLAIAEGVSRPRSVLLLLVAENCGFGGRGFGGCLDDVVGFDKDVFASLATFLTGPLSLGGLFDEKVVLEAGRDSAASASFLLSFDAAAINLRGSFEVVDLVLDSLASFVLDWESVAFEMGAFPFWLL